MLVPTRSRSSLPARARPYPLALVPTARSRRRRPHPPRPGHRRCRRFRPHLRFRHPRHRSRRCGRVCSFVLALLLVRARAAPIRSGVFPLSCLCLFVRACAALVVHARPLPLLLSAPITNIINI